MRVGSIEIHHRPAHTLPSDAACTGLAIEPDYRPHVLVVRDADGTLHPGQSPEYVGAMAQSIELSAARINAALGHRTRPSFADAWSFAGTAMSSFFLGRRGVSSVTRTSRSFNDLRRFAARLNEQSRAPSMTVHAGHGWTRPSLIEARIQSIVTDLLHKGRKESGRTAFLSGGYALFAIGVGTDAGSWVPSCHEFELRIAAPRLDAALPPAHTVWRLESAEGAVAGTLRLSQDFCHHHDFDHPRHALAIEGHLDHLLSEAAAARSLPARLMFAYEAYWWMLRQNKEAVGDKALHVLTATLLAMGHQLPPAPAGRDPALEALSRTLPDWLGTACEMWGRGIGLQALRQRELIGRFPQAPRLAPQQADIDPLDEVLCMAASPGARARRAQIEAAMAERLQENLRIA